LAPEIASGEAYNESCDMWSCGVIMYHLITGKLPFREPTAKKTLEAIKTADVKYDNSTWKKYDLEAKNLVMGLLDRNPVKRIKASEALNHPWLEKACLSDEKNRVKI
jgi:calcium-dependent protein kinase